MDLQELFINETATVMEALKKLDKVAVGILYVVEDRKLKAALTDGDIRRHLLNNGGVNEQVKEIANYKPVTIDEHHADQAQQKMKENKIRSIPILNEMREIIKVYFIDDSTLSKRKAINYPVVIMAGGKGTRLYPYTKVLPKPLIPVGELPIAEHIINQFLEYECTDFHFIVNHKKEMIKAYFAEKQNDRSYTVTFYDEEKPLGTGGGLSLLKGKIKEPFFLTNCDIIIRCNYEDIVKFHKENNNTITMVCAYKHFTVPYGVIETGENAEIEKMSEKPEFSFLTNTGFYLVEPSVLDEMEENKSMGFPDIIDAQKAKGKRVAVYPIGEKAWLDMGQIEEMEAMRKELGV